MKAEGTWNPLWDGIEELDPEWTEHYLTATMQPYQSGVLSPQVVQLLCIAVDASCTHMYAPGLRRHIRAALDLGVTAREIVEVLKLATTIGIHSLNIGVPLLLEELSSQGRVPESDRAGHA
ncbi:carboxymuconolactone decarboxylase family protein [Rhodococcus sp. PSBB066]|nr:carboxymuconolactone decarboxylase family protein [Rhodococcus aetherivorans]QSE62035.1 carboxymuconolactone decarboxylase family protein [Rhodococcus sp. PSBB066]QSE72071.1 carboxymuconolactone decarboxylase family protein [Rhodococcus sp. PSBB049]USC14883.1 carboxymuconolactone decarboxylase family protein [Rhodococcus sp. 11-3]